MSLRHASIKCRADAPTPLIFSRAACALAHPGTGSIVTVSIGVASCVPLRHSSDDALLAQADRALYKAKRHGRDQIRWEEEPMSGNILPLPSSLRADARRSAESVIARG